MRILVTGADGFVGKNLKIRLAEIGRYETLEFTRGRDVAELRKAVAAADAVVHLAGENRPTDPAAFETVNAGLTRSLCDAIRAEARPIPLLLASSIQAERDNPYGRSKRAAEQAVEALAETTRNPCAIYRLPNVFGKWCRPNYNSAVATFCHNIARGLPIRVDDTGAPLRLVYIDDVVSAFLEDLEKAPSGLKWTRVEPEFETTVGAVAEQIKAFAASRSSLVTERVGTGLTRALYATYVSYLPSTQFAYELPAHGDERGVFVEMLKTPDCGQFSFFTAHPGVTRGRHYHHSKTEKFLVIKGRARFGFRHIVSEEYFELATSGEKPVIVETIPGWSHDITNVGDEELVVMLWANEIFDRDRPDTIPRNV
jgi:UDP-2-acetamido-2,6-beta-L-arabino-hexul-4-ose reductase